MSSEGRIERAVGAGEALATPTTPPNICQCPHPAGMISKPLQPLTCTTCEKAFDRLGLQRLFAANEEPDTRELLLDLEQLILTGARMDARVDKSDWIRIWVKVRRRLHLPCDSGDWLMAYDTRGPQ